MSEPPRPLGVGVPAIPTPFVVRTIAVIGCGTIGAPMAALLAHARVCIGTNEPARVVVVQRGSAASGWKVDAINAGHSPIGGVESELADMVRDSVQAGLLRATDGYAICREADVIVVCVQTDAVGNAPDYRALLDALRAIAHELSLRSQGSAPLVVIESTLAPSSLRTIVHDVFRCRGFEDGRDIYIGYSPSRAMRGRLVERLATSDKIVAGLVPESSQRVAALYAHVTGGTLHLTNVLSAELAKTLENAYRDVRIALAAEIARYCDARDIDFYALREWLNGELLQRDVASFRGTAVPHGGLLIPTLGVGGSGLAKDGALLWWRASELGASSEHSLVFEARRINNESPFLVGTLVDRLLGGRTGRKIALLGTAYKFNTDDTRNSPTLVLARDLRNSGAVVRLHDPYVQPNDVHVHAAGFTERFTQSLEQALDGAELAVLCVAHRDYVEDVNGLLRHARQLRVMLDAANGYDRRVFADSGVQYGGIGRGTREPPNDLRQVVYDAFRVVERAFANEVAALVQLLNAHYAPHDFARARFEQLQVLVGTCPTGCAIADPGPAAPALDHGDFSSRLVAHAIAASSRAASASDGRGVGGRAAS